MKIFDSLKIRSKKAVSKRDETQLLDPSPVVLEEEQRWMLQAKSGNEAAFASIYERYKGPIMSYVYQIVRDQNISEELTQETFLRAYRHREGYEPSAKVSTWLWTIARNVAIDQLRKTKEVPHEDLSQYAENSDNAETQLIERSSREQIEECMDKLLQSQKEALTLRTVSELNYEEIGTLMQLSLSSVKSLIHRAKMNLTECLKTKGVYE